MGKKVSKNEREGATQNLLIWRPLDHHGLTSMIRWLGLNPKLYVTSSNEEIHEKRLPMGSVNSWYSAWQKEKDTKQWVKLLLLVVGIEVGSMLIAIGQ